MYLLYSNKHFRVGGLGVEGQQNDLRDSRASRSYSVRYSGVGPTRKSAGRNPEHLKWKRVRYFAAVPLDFLRGSTDSVSSGLQKCVQNFGAHLTVNVTLWGF